MEIVKLCDIVSQSKNSGVRDMDITAQSGDEREKNDEINRKNGRIYE